MALTVATKAAIRAALGRMAHTGGWLVVAALLAVAVARLVAWDRTAVLVALNALTPVLYLPAWLVAVGAGLARRWRLLAGAGLVVVAHLAFALPELLAAEPLPAGAAAGAAKATFRVFDANVFAGNDRFVENYAQEIRANRPDLVLLQESSPAFLAGLEASGALDPFPYRLAVARDDPFSALIASRYELRETDVVSVRGRPVVLRATIDPGSGPVRILAVHAVSPVGGTRAEWAADLARIAALVRAESAASARPVLVGGDFNATWGHKAFRNVLAAGLTDAAAARGKPYHMTWSNDWGLIPPLVRIDHVLTTDRLAVTRIAVGTGLGSDHRPLIAEVAVL